MTEEKNNRQGFTELGELGEFALIEHLTKSIKLNNPSTVKGIGDDAAVMQYKQGKQILATCDLLVEGIHFNPVYCPLKHLGYKAAVVNFSDIYAMNGYPKQMIVGIALSSKYTLEAVEELYRGMLLACERYGVDFVGGDTTSSPRGMMLSVTVMGEAEAGKVVYRSGAGMNDLICVSGDIGSAYAGLLVLQREEKTFLANPNHVPELEPYHYVVERQLKPEAGKSIIEKLDKSGIIPTAMIDISDGLASELFHISRNSTKGFKIYEETLPISQQCIDVAEEFGINPLTFALNGGEDYELLFTVDLKYHEEIKKIPEITIIGHITDETNEKVLLTRAGQVVELQAQGWDAFRK